MTILQRILETKKAEVDAARKRRSVEQLERDARSAPATRPFAAAVSRRNHEHPNLIAEVKKASPSAGVIVPDYDPTGIARLYEMHGAAAISVLTDSTYFQGTMADLQTVKAAVRLPVLRKDFIIDEYQILEARVGGADAILLIAEAIGISRIAELFDLARAVELATLIEVHSSANLDRVLERLGAPSVDGYLLGINNRDLAAQRTDVHHCVRLSKRLPAGSVWVAESGIGGRHEVKLIHAAGAAAMLIGESLLRAKHIQTAISEILGS
jgi:indole-3-glycerol phosphate synthase